MNALRRAAKGKRAPRRLKYFTFCAVGALDVLLLDREKVLRRSDAKEFDTVFFFYKDEESVLETRKRIPGAVGFPGDFVDVMLQEQADVVATAADRLDSPANAANTREVRQTQNKQAQLQAFSNAFPFDVLNLDVEQYLFRPKEELPGKLASALRKLFEWQKKPGKDKSGKNYSVDEFTLMFTTQVGPKDLPDAYIRYLRDTCLQHNLTKFAELNEPFMAKSNGKNVTQFFIDDFDGAFKLAVPKSLIELAFESDWHIDGVQGIEVYQFDRDFNGGQYRMLHMAMTVRRQVPARERRGPGQQVLTAEAEHRKAIESLFMRDVIAVEGLVVGEQKTELESDLKKLFAHREKYYRPAPQVV